MIFTVPCVYFCRVSASFLLTAVVTGLAETHLPKRHFQAPENRLTCAWFTSPTNVHLICNICHYFYFLLFIHVQIRFPYVIIFHFYITIHVLQRQYPIILSLFFFILIDHRKEKLLLQLIKTYRQMIHFMLIRV